ncbi:hypothetical protein, partial [Kribbella sp.]|uniref:hypothetical protein n=1 Tax=Kribbella sp. TaxID=1871183 RepID=UPI002D58E76C
SQGGPGQQQGGDKDRSPAALDTEMAQQHALSGQQPLTSVSNKRTAGAVQAGVDDATRRTQQNAQTQTKTPNGKDGR